MLHFAPVQIVLKTQIAISELRRIRASDEMEILTMCNGGGTTRLHFLQQWRFLFAVPNTNTDPLNGS